MHSALTLDDSLDQLAEEAGDLEGERQAGVLGGPDGIDALARHVERLGQLHLARPAFGARWP